MEHRIATGVIVESGGKVLLVRRLKPGVYDFWVPPGGGAIGDEDLRDTVKREALEECGLEVEPDRALYVQNDAIAAASFAIARRDKLPNGRTYVPA